MKRTVSWALMGKSRGLWDLPGDTMPSLGAGMGYREKTGLSLVRGLWKAQCLQDPPC